MTDSAPNVTPVEEIESAVRDSLGAEYRIERTLGQGGMSIVFLAEELSLARRVALKVFPQALAIEKSAADRFRHEARIAASLEHPHIAPIHRFGAASGFLWYAMKFINGHSLAETLQQVGRMDLYSVLSLAEQMAGALDCAHRHGIVHRDMKPSNVMLDDDSWAFVCDFGVAKRRDTKLTQTGGTLGTPAYMSPEQLYGRPLDGRSDQYSLAVMLFELLAGRHPFPSESVAELVQMHCTAPPPPLSELRPDVPQRLVLGIQRAMSKEPEERFDSVITFLTAIGGRRPPRAPQPRVSVQVTEAVTQRLPVTPPPAGWRRAASLLGAAGLGVVATWAVMSFTPLGAMIRPTVVVTPDSAPPVPLPAHLTINSVPWGTVYIDGDSVGNTPVFDLTVSAGTHRLRILRQGYLPVERTLDLTSGQALRLTDITLKRAP
jgi:tRNA A-37 threonylcarbamoyl transferase component Bud32